MIKYPNYREFHTKLRIGRTHYKSNNKFADKKIHMSNFIFVITLLSLSLFGNSQNYSYLGSFNSLGVPNYLTTNDVIPQNLLTSIAASLPESFPVPTYHPNYIANGTNSSIYMQDSGEVWVTFVDEGAGYRNVLGYYSYPAATPPASIPSNNNLKIVFPNVSKLNSGGGLVAGNKVYLGSFSAGTVISWFLIADGFRNGTVGNGNWRLFSNPNFNPEAAANLKYHNVLLYDSTYKKVILGFEDIRRDYSSCDNDFNDAIFYITSNPITAIQTSSMNSTTNPSESVSSGNNGGLESNGDLAFAISNRYFKRMKNQIIAKEKQTTENKYLPTIKESPLANLIPDLSAKLLLGKLSTPEDLTLVSNAKEALSVDYYNELDTRTGVILITQTNDNVYNHTKSICDRLKGGKLLKISTKIVQGIEFIEYQIQQANNDIEYITCFSVSEENNQFTLYNKWLLHEYPTKSNYLNFQVWSNLPHIHQFMLESLLDKLNSITTVTNDNTNRELPKSFIQQGFIINDSIKFKVLVKENSSNAKLVFHYTQSEKDTRKNQEFPIVFAQSGNQEFTLPFPQIFDADIQLVINDTIKDEIYLADGAWGVEYEEKSTQLKEFNILTYPSIVNQDELSVKRGIQLNALTRDYITAYKMLRPSNIPMDLTNYNYINIEYASNYPFTIRLNKDEIDTWNNQAKCSIPSSATTRTLSIPFHSIQDIKGTNLRMNDVTSISFTLQPNSPSQTEIDLNIQRVSFSKNPTFPLLLDMKNVTIYPNPIQFNEDLNIQLTSNNNSEIDITIVAMSGELVSSQHSQINKGINTFSVQLPKHLSPGQYLLHAKSDEDIKFIKFIVQ